jgi:hypothetical protein
VKVLYFAGYSLKGEGGRGGTKDSEEGEKRSNHASLGRRKKLKFWSYTDQSSLWSGESEGEKGRNRESEKKLKFWGLYL